MSSPLSSKPSADASAIFAAETEEVAGAEENQRTRVTLPLAHQEPKAKTRVPPNAMDHAITAPSRVTGPVNASNASVIETTESGRRPTRHHPDQAEAAEEAIEVADKVAKAGQIIMPHRSTNPSLIRLQHLNHHHHHQIRVNTTTRPINTTTTNHNITTTRTWKTRHQHYQ